MGNAILLHSYHMIFSRRRFTGLGAGVVGGAFGLRGLSAARSRPKALIVFVVTQFRSDYLDRFAPAFSATGFRRLLEDGAFFPDCQMACASFTSSGLATISTGSYPQNHGTVADFWYDRAAQAPVAAARARLEATTLAEQVLDDDPKNRVFSIGFDYERAALQVGRSFGRVVPIISMDDRGEFSVNGGEEPIWMAAFNQQNSPENLRDAKWVALGARDSAPPLRTLGADNFYALYKASPYAQSAQIAMVRELIVQEKIGAANFDMLAIVSEPMEMLGYETGADSPLMREMVLHLDRQIALLLDTLDHAVGAQNYAFVFTGAHGAPRGRETGTSPGIAVRGETVARVIEQALSGKPDAGAGKDRVVDRYLYPFLYLRPDPLRRRDLRSLRTQAGEAALRAPGVAGYCTADGESSHSGEWLRRFRNSFHATRSGDVMLAYAPEAVEYYGSGRGISYGSVYNYDSRVPLIFYGAGFEGFTFDSLVESVDIAPTLARVCGLAWPSSTTGRVLGEAIAASGK